MNGIHDVGGMHDMGDLPFESNEPVFHADWERTVLAVNVVLTLSGVYNTHELRYAIERIPPVEYLDSPYYVHWLDGIQRLLLEKGYVTDDELANRRVISPAPTRSASAEHPTPPNPPRFNVGDRIRARNINPRTHTRLPRYVRGRLGSVVSCVGAYPFADNIADGKGDVLQHVYNVRFDGAELWGPDAGPKDAVHIDLYENYMEPA